MPLVLVALALATVAVVLVANALTTLPAYGLERYAPRTRWSVASDEDAVGVAVHGGRVRAGRTTVPYGESFPEFGLHRFVLGFAAGGTASFVAPSQVVIRRDDVVELSVDGRGRLRRVTNRTLGTSWTVPVRVVGDGNRGAAVFLGPLFLAIPLLGVGVAIWSLTAMLGALGALGDEPQRGGAQLGLLLLPGIVLAVLAAVLVFLRRLPALPAVELTGATERGSTRLDA